MEIEQNRTTVRTNNNSSISGGSSSVDLESTTHVNQVEESDDVESDDLSYVISKSFEHQSSMRMWWYDAYEAYEGFVYLFGKIFDEACNEYTSCCVIVENIQREIYVLPRKHQVDENGNSTGQPVTLDDVKHELKNLLESNNVSNYQMETCQRKYVFGMPGVPREAEYIKLNYPYTDYQFPQEATGSTFSNIFGTTVSPLEGFLIQKKIMGPCWLEFKNLRSSQGNFWCSFETRIELPSDCLVVESDETPPLNSLALSIQTKFNYSTKNTEIIAISGYYCKSVNIYEQDVATLSPSERFSVTRPISFAGPSSKRTVINPESDFTIIQERSEELMLRAFLAKLQTLDPDIIIGHEFSTIGLSILLRRMKLFHVNTWNIIGRRISTTWPKSLSTSNDTDETTYQEKLTMCGRLVCDTFLASQDVISCKSYSLQDMALSELGISREEITSNMMVTFEQQGILATELAHYGSFDSYLSMSIAVKLKIVPLTKQLSNLAGNLWSRCIYGARSERNEYLLLHSFYNEGYICPDRPDWKNRFKGPLFVDENNLQLYSSRKEKAKTNSESYTGGLVLDPKTGIYNDYILLLDFNSLYPSIIQEYNVCFTTMEQGSDDANYNAQEIPSTPSPGVVEGILPKLVSIFINRRNEVKKSMKSRNISLNSRTQYNIEQLALKLTANSMYGCLGSSTSRFYARHIAMYITSKGRNILQSTVDTTEKLGYEVVYGDTDSIMVNTKTKTFGEAKQAAEQVKKAVNCKYKLLEIGVDGYFKSTLLLKKKKYAMLSVKEGPNELELTEKVEFKGLDLVRRDWCDLSRSISENVLRLILFGKKSLDIFEYLTTISNQIDNAEYDVDKFIIRKKLTKSPDEYDSSKFFPHVSVAKDMRRDREPVKAGDVIAYIMCKSGLPGDNTVKACTPEAVKKGKAEISKFDSKWYICRQIIPPILRLCTPMEDINLEKISECFGKIILSFRRSDQVY
ncbi:DNA polymerase family B-domain-containing protein [Helicostylum pulchrum]|nr:DNA polymerase family B-domain-containing protein [Helicostylum pulchrum]